MMYYTLALPILFFAQRSDGTALRFFGRPRGNQTHLVDLLVFYDHIESKEVADAMYQVDRKYYVKIDCYGDFPQRIGFGAFASPAYMDAFALEHLKDHLKKGNRALDVACGTGYLTVCMALMVGDSGYAVGQQYRKELVEYSNQSLSKHAPSLLGSGRVRFVNGDLRQGVPEFGPYDVIHVGAAPDDVPEQLLDQLKVGGRLMIPLISDDQTRQDMMAYDKLLDGTVVETLIKGEFYDFLIDKVQQWPYRAELNVP